MTTATLPDKVTATLADAEGNVYHLEDRRGYTHQRATIRVKPGAIDGYHRRAYSIQRLGRDGWHEVMTGSYPEHEPGPPVGDAVLRAVSILFGMEDHG